MIRALAKAALRRSPYRVLRTRGSYRYDSIEEFLTQAARAGFRPDLIIDGGAHTGSFAKKAMAAFPAAPIYMIDPQPACAAELAALAASEPRLRFAPYALAAEPGQLLLQVNQDHDTGAHIGFDASTCVAIDAKRLDDVIPDAEQYRNTFLKLDLQGYELEALKGASKVLAGTELILTEVSFFRQAYEPPILELMSFLWDHGFELFDIAALNGRFRDNRLRQGDFAFVRRGSPLHVDTAWD